MVTTNSAATILKVTVESLRKSSFSEDIEVISGMVSVVKAAIQQLKPLLPYVDQQIGLEPEEIRGIIVVNGAPDRSLSALILGRDGSWYTRSIYSKNANLAGLDVWERYYFSDIIEGLDGIFAEACVKKEKHLEEIKVRSRILSEMVAIARGEKSSGA